MRKYLLLLPFIMTSCQKNGDNQPRNDQPQTVPSTQLPQPPSEDDEIYSTGGQLNHPNTGDLVLDALASVAEAPADKLIGGTVADPKMWPASFITSQGNSRCTGTMIGPKVLQLAAHCVGNGRVAAISVNGETVRSVCTHSPKYARDSTADYALCLMEKEVDLPWYESVLLPSTAKIKVGDPIILAGMGCTQPGGGGGDSRFRVGQAPVIRLPVNNNDIVTRGSSALCFGDSGGSAFWKDENGVLKVAGVNSRGDIQSTSYLSAVYTKDGNDFYSSWVVKNNAPICGISQGVKKCRGDEDPTPPVDPVPVWCKKTYDTIGSCIFGNPRLSLTQPEMCQEEYGKLFACQVASERPE